MALQENPRMDDISQFILAHRHEDNLPDGDAGEVVQRHHQFAGSSSGYSTPMTPIPVDFPSITPRATMLIPDSNLSFKRQRTLSALEEFTRQCSSSFDLADDEIGVPDDFQHIWESLDTTEPTVALLLAASEPPPQDKSGSPPAKLFVEGQPKERKKREQKSPSRSPKPSKVNQNKRKQQQSAFKKAPAAVKQIVTTRRPPSSLSSIMEGSPASDRHIAGLIPGACSLESRKEKVARYLEKRKRRVWKKEIKYSCRKQFAESRPRVAGRFIPKSTSTPALLPSDEAQMATSGKLLIGADSTKPRSSISSSL
jgi:hypothetical protein